MSDSPSRLTALIVAGSLLGVGGFLAAELRPVHRSLLLLVTCFVCVVVGLGAMYWASYTLREAVRNERWSAGTLAPFRSVTDHVLWKIGMALLVVAMFFSLAQDRHHRIWFWAVLLLLQTQTQLSGAFALPRKPTRSGAPLDWTQTAKLTSEHWGER